MGRSIVVSSFALQVCLAPYACNTLTGNQDCSAGGSAVLAVTDDSYIVGISDPVDRVSACKDCDMLVLRVEPRNRVSQAPEGSRAELADLRRKRHGRVSRPRLRFSSVRFRKAPSPSGPW